MRTFVVPQHVLSVLISVKDPLRDFTPGHVNPRTFHPLENFTLRTFPWLQLLER